MSFKHVLTVLFVISIALTSAHAALEDKEWTTILASTGDDWSNSIAQDSSGNIYVTGRTNDAAHFTGTLNHIYGSTGGVSDVFVSKTNPQGVLQWTVILASTAQDGGYFITSDDSGNVYVTGRTDDGVNFAGESLIFGTPGSEDVFISKINTQGVLQWTTIIASTNIEEGDSLALDDAGNIYLTGFTYDAATIGGGPDIIYGSLGSTDAFISKFDSDGILQWTTVLAESANQDRGYSLVVDDSENIYVSGYTHDGVNFVGGSDYTFGLTGLSDAFVAKLNSLGSLEWATILASTNEETSYSLALDDSGNTYLTGFTMGGTTIGGGPNRTVGSTTGETAFISKFDSDGVLQWTTVAGSNANDGGNSITLDNSGNIYVSGYTRNGADFAGTPDYIFGSVGSTYSVFSMRLNPSGINEKTTILASSGDSFGLQSILDNSGNILITGTAGDGTDFGGSPDRTYGSTGGDEDGFITELGGVYTNIEFPLLQADGVPYGSRLYIEKGEILEGDVRIGTTDADEGGWSSFIIELPDITTGGPACNFVLECKDEIVADVPCVAGGEPGNCQCDIINWLKDDSILPYNRGGDSMVNDDNELIAGGPNVVSFKTDVPVDTDLPDTNTGVVKASAPLSSSNVIIINDITRNYVTVINSGSKSAGVDYDVVDANGVSTYGRQGYGLLYGDKIYFYDDAQTGDQNLIRINLGHVSGAYTLYLSNFLVDTDGNIVVDNLGNPVSPGVDYSKSGYVPNTVPVGFTKDILVYKPVGSPDATFVPSTCVYSGTGVSDIVAAWSAAKAGCSGVTTQSTIDTQINTDLGWTGEWFVYTGASGSGGGANPPPSGVPEFSDIAYVLAAILGAGGFFAIRRKKSF